MVGVGVAPVARDLAIDAGAPGGRPFERLEQQEGRAQPGQQAVLAGALQEGLEAEGGQGAGDHQRERQQQGEVGGGHGVSGSQRYRLALYRDGGGVPGAKVFETREQQISSGTAARRYCSDAPVFPVAAGYYWIALHTAGTAGIIRDYYDGTATNWYGNADAFNDGAASAFGAGNAGGGTMTLSAEYFPNNEVRAVGRATAA